MSYSNSVFAQVYGEGAFGTCNYNETTVGCTPPGTSKGGNLSDTGFLVVAIVTVACVVMLVGILVRFWRRKARLQAQKSTVEEVDVRLPNDR